MQHCSVPSGGQCYSRIQSGSTVRGCRNILASSEVEQCRNTTASSQCTTTQGQGSNNRIIPLNRRKCFHCDSRIDATCSGMPANASTLPCKRFSQAESCLKLELNGAGTNGRNFSYFSLSLPRIFFFSCSRMCCRFQRRYLFTRRVSHL